MGRPLQILRQIGNAELLHTAAQYRILVVDGFEPFRRSVVSALQHRAEFQVTEASNGLEAVEKAEEQQPDLILLDIELPILSGMMVARRVRKLAPASRILFLGQEFSSAAVQEALGLGVLGYVHKPRAHIDLLPAIEAVFGGKRFVSCGLEFSEGESTSPTSVNGARSAQCETVDAGENKHF